ncbi:hypothetical protein [Jannaschia marina]|uniref:hypothetical protein n=1 Tax=Jannaschia marina TaxID=2741674 RepID=UPI0015C7CEA4|nr:hypothetical protein [Jannaschia marina]
MTQTPYLYEHAGRLYFRRRVPGLSASIRPVMVSLGTTDRRSGHTSCVKLTARMDEMLDDDLHITLLEADVTAFFQAELKRCIRRLSARRRVERMDGSLTADKVRRNDLMARLLKGMVDHGICETVPQVVADQLDETARAGAYNLQEELFRKVTSEDYGDELVDRASACGLPDAASDALRLELRWAALEANAAAHAALEDVPLNYGPSAHQAAVSPLREVARVPACLAGHADPGSTEFECVPTVASQPLEATAVSIEPLEVLPDPWTGSGVF